MKYPKTNYAFTTVEIIIVTVIIALTAMISVVSIYRNVEQVNLNSSGTDLIRLMRFSRFLAVESQSSCTVHIDFDNNTYWLQAAEAPAQLLDEKLRPTIENLYQRPRKLPESVSFLKASIDEQPYSRGIIKINFNRDGSNQQTLMQICSGDNINTILVAPDGLKPRLANHAIEKSPNHTVDLDEISITADNFFVK
ncbi:MAG: hypothetical protein JEZ07_00035 [Phycisphaerae bacterium]|nr:hypothetical protein [Phycisphaerae bacterium]